METPIPLGSEVLVAVSHCGVCHSDIHLWKGYYDLGGGMILSLLDRGVKLPLTLGHEVFGRVVGLGPEASGVSIGDRRIVYPWVGCGHCPQCAREADNMCANQRTIGIYRDGGYGSHIVVPHSKYLVDPGTIDPATAATYACSGITVYSAIRKVMPLPPDDAIVVIGAGGLGLNAIAVLKAVAHRNIVVVDTAADKRAAALSLGASTVFDPLSDDAVKGLQAAGGGEIAAVIDLVSNTATARLGFDVLRKGGKLVQVGMFGGELSFSLPMMPLRALTIQGSNVGSLQDLRELVALAQNGAVEALPVELMAAERATEALERLDQGRVTGRIVLETQ